MTVRTYQEVLEAVTSNDQRTRNALRWLLSLQTNSETIIKDSLEVNGAGFRAKYQNRDDAGTARKLILGGDWDAKARRSAQSLCYTYRRQLTARANGCESRAQIGAFKLRAVYDRDSRAYARYVQETAAQVPVQVQEPTVNNLSAAIAKLAEAVNRLKVA